LKTSAGQAFWLTLELSTLFTRTFHRPTRPCQGKRWQIFRDG